MAEDKSSAKTIYESQASLYQKALNKLAADELIVQSAYRINNYLLAATMFEEVGDYKDAPAKAQYCREQAKKAEEQSVKTRYEAAVFRKDHIRQTEELQKLAEEFEALGDYQDSKEQAEKIRSDLKKTSRKGRVVRVLALAVLLCLAAGAAAVYFSGFYKYVRGIFYLQNGQYTAAASAFEKMPGFLNSDQYLEESRIAPLIKANLGNDVKYGKYKWKILSRENNVVTMIASDIGEDHLFYRVPFHNTAEEVTWADSDLRRWLNTEVMETIFSDSERARLLPQQTEPAENPDYPTGYSEGTTDYLRLLTVAEATGDTWKKKISELGQDYWLSCPGSDLHRVCFIDSTHSVKTFGAPATDQDMMVRPVIQVDCSPNAELAAAERSTEETEETAVFEGEYQDLMTAAVGSDVQFGSYSWKILDREGTVVRMIAAAVNDSHPFYKVPFNEDGGETDWESSSLRKWLNTEALELFFDEEEKGHLLPQTSGPSANEEYNTAYTQTCEDYMTLLTAQEAQGVGMRRKLKQLGRNFWLRTPGDTMETVSYVDGEHVIRSYGAPSDDPTIAVRPVILVDCSGASVEDNE